MWPLLGRASIAVTLVVLLFGFLSCTNRPPLVTSAETQAWQREYEEELMAAEEEARRARLQHTPTVSELLAQQEREEERTKPRGFVGVLSDIIAFPFRGIGWVVQALL